MCGWHGTSCAPDDGKATKNGCARTCTLESMASSLFQTYVPLSHRHRHHQRIRRCYLPDGRRSSTFHLLLWQLVGCNFPLRPLLIVHYLNIFFNAKWVLTKPIEQPPEIKSIVCKSIFRLLKVECIFHISLGRYRDLICPGSQFSIRSIVLVTYWALILLRKWETLMDSVFQHST